MRGRVDEYEIIADGLSRQVQVGLAGGVAALYPGLPQNTLPLRIPICRPAAQILAARQATPDDRPFIPGASTATRS